MDSSNKLALGWGWGVPGWKHRSVQISSSPRGARVWLLPRLSGIFQGPLPLLQHRKKARNITRGWSRNIWPCLRQAVCWGPPLQMGRYLSVRCYHRTAQTLKNLPASAGDANLIPGVGRSPGQGINHLLQYSSPWTPVHGVTKSQSRLSD